MYLHSRVFFTCGNRYGKIMESRSFNLEWDIEALAKVR